jgi:hypothetical protein
MEVVLGTGNVLQKKNFSQSCETPKSSREGPSEKFTSKKIFPTSRYEVKLRERPAGP